MNSEFNTLIHKVLSRDENASLRLYEIYEKSWFRVCLRYASHRSEAEDIMQDGLVLIFRDLQQFDSNKGHFESWSNKIMVNSALKYFRKHQWQKSFEAIDQSLEIQDFDMDAIDRISAKEITYIIQQLPLGYRMIFNMYAIEGYTHRQISEALNISISTSKSQLFKARNVLKQKIELLF